jgi:DNA-binding NtrC family response regulator
MSILTAPQRAFLELISRLAYCNPFTPERIERERQALGDDFDEQGADWNLRPRPEEHRPNVDRLVNRAGAICMQVRARVSSDQPATAEELRLYEDAVHWMLYHRYRERLSALISDAPEEAPPRVDFYGEFLREVEAQLSPLGGQPLPASLEPPHLLAILFQIRRAFHHIHRHIIGASPSVARLRAEVWQSIFTHDLARYRRALYDRMGEFTTLITGPSGTGKELVARAIALSRYIPFHPRARTFKGDPQASFHALNLSALPATLVESELFGHRRGAFTGAVADHQGYLSICPPEGTVFLDEVGDLDPTIQVKLLRVLQARTFQAVGATDTEHFQGKLMAATNRDLTRALREGALREDFYYRICADSITTPSLAARLRESPEDLRLLLDHIAWRLVGPAEAPGLADEVERWIEEHLGSEYPWPGNVRELQQCTQNVLVRGAYRPVEPAPAPGVDRFAAAIRQGSLTADELLRDYCTLVHARCGSYVEAAKRLQMDRRTVKARVDESRLPDLLGDAAAGSPPDYSSVST